MRVHDVVKGSKVISRNFIYIQNVVQSPRRNTSVYAKRRIYWNIIHRTVGFVCAPFVYSLSTYPAMHNKHEDDFHRPVFHLGYLLSTNRYGRKIPKGNWLHYVRACVESGKPCSPTNTLCKLPLPGPVRDDSRGEGARGPPNAIYVHVYPCSYPQKCSRKIFPVISLQSLTSHLIFGSRSSPTARTALRKPTGEKITNLASRKTS